jgi:transcriptional regulator with XRE-family HTH domain
MRANNPSPTRTIREVISNAGIAQENIADLLKVSPAAVCLWASGKRVPRTVLALRLGAALGYIVELDEMNGLVFRPVVGKPRSTGGRDNGRSRR